MGNFSVALHLRTMDTELARALARADRGGNDLDAIATGVRGHLDAASTHLESALTGMAGSGIKDTLRANLFEVGGLQPIVTPKGMRDSIARASEAWSKAPADNDSFQAARNTLVLPHERAQVATEGVALLPRHSVVGTVGILGVGGLIAVRAASGSQAHG